MEEVEIESISLKCKTLRQLFEEYGVSFIECLRVDTEGHDFEILKTLNSTDVRPREIICERKHMDGTFNCGARYEELVGFLHQLKYSVKILNEENSIATLSGPPKHP